MKSDIIMSTNEIILYQPNDSLKLDVRVQDESVWLTRKQIAELFGRDVKTIGKHVSNALKEELAGLPVVAKFAITATDGKTYQVEHYNLEMITSIGYRVKSPRGVQFRIWANKVIRDYLLRGYSVNQRLMLLEDRIDRKFLEHDRHLLALDDKVDFFVRSSLKPIEGIFFNGQIFDAYAFIAEIIRQAKERIVLIDNYVDDSVLLQLSKRAPAVTVDIYCGHVSHQLQQDVGKKLFAFSKMQFVTGSELIARL